MSTHRTVHRRHGFWKHHSLSLVAGGILLLWIVLFADADPRTRWGSFFGNAIADWSGVVVTILATKYLYEIGSVESRQPHGHLPSRLREALRNHSLTIFLGLTGAGWVVFYLKLDPEMKWGRSSGTSFPRLRTEIALG